MDNVKFMTWNSSGWQGKNVQARGTILQGLAADVAFICETWEWPGIPLVVQGYEWIGNPCSHNSKKQLRGSGGVGFFIKSAIKQDYKNEIVDNSTDGIIALLLTNKHSSYKALVIGVYIPRKIVSMVDTLNNSSKT